MAMSVVLFEAALIAFLFLVSNTCHLWNIHFLHKSQTRRIVGGALLSVLGLGAFVWCSVWLARSEILDHEWYPLLFLPFPVIVWGLYVAILAIGRRWPKFYTYLALEATHQT
jgi:hypothetical protein